MARKPFVLDTAPLSDEEATSSSGEQHRTYTIEFLKLYVSWEIDGRRVWRHRFKEDRES